MPCLMCTISSICSRYFNRDAVSGEFYLTEVPAMLRSKGKQVEIVPGVPAEDILSINTPAQLADVDAILQNRLHMEATT